MSDNGWTRLIEDRSVRRECAGTDDATWQPDRISQADSFRDLALGIAGMLTLAAIANLFILGL